MLLFSHSLQRSASNPLIQDLGDRGASHLASVKMFMRVLADHLLDDTNVEKRVTS